MSATFFAPNAQALTRHLEVNVSNVNAAELTILLGLDTAAGIEASGGAFGEVDAPVMLEAIRRGLRSEDAAHSGYISARLCDLYDLAEEAVRLGSSVAWG